MSTYYTNGIMPGTTITTLPPCPHCEYNITFQGTPPRHNTCHRCSPWLYLPTKTMKLYTQSISSNSTTITYPKWTPHDITLTNTTFDFKIID